MKTQMLTLALLPLVCCLSEACSFETGDNTTQLSTILPDSAWPERRREIEKRWLDLLGDFPQEVPALKPRMQEVDHTAGITRYHVSFQTESDDRVTAWLLVPDAAQQQPTPAIISVHSTTWGSGKDQVIGLSGRRPVDPARDPQVEAGDAFSWFLFPGGHAFPGVARRMTFTWFDRWLGRTME